MYYTPVIKNFNISELIEKYDCKVSPPEIAELCVLENKENKNDGLIKLIEQSRKIHKVTRLEPIFNIRGEYIPQINYQQLQVQEKEFIKSSLLDYWYKPFEVSGNISKLTPKIVCDNLQKMLVRYLKINAVITSECRAYEVKYNSKDGKEVNYFNIKSDWYNDDGLKWQGLSINYGRATNNISNELMIKMGKFYQRMGYVVKKEKSMLLEKDNKQWYIELNKSKIKKEHTEALNRLIVNYELWTKYLAEYKPLTIDL